MPMAHRDCASWFSWHCPPHAQKADEGSSDAKGQEAVPVTKEEGTAPGGWGLGAGDRSPN